jgi:hypothetical protein
MWMIIGVVVLFIGMEVYSFVPDYSRRGELVSIGNTTAYVLSCDRNFWLNERQEIEVMYCDTFGVWHVQKFPKEFVKPYTFIPKIIPNLNENH